MIKSGKFALKHGDTLATKLDNAFDYVKPKYLDNVAGAFKGKPIAVRLNRDIKVYRRWGGISEKMGSPWFTIKPYTHPGNAKRYLALPGDSTAKQLSEFVIPADTVVLIGKVADQTKAKHFGSHAVGGGIQIYLPNPSLARKIK